jgi:SAM-dependent methyltransferase
MSVFSSVDTSDDPDRARRYLDAIAAAATGMKHYAMAAHARRAPEGFVLDVGCGAGHDLLLLESAGLAPLGVDPSASLLAVARARTGARVPLARAEGSALPFRDGSIAACRMERVLMHVDDPAAVVAEIVRCLRPGALLTAFEPDWEAFTVRGDHGDEPCGWISNVGHPGVGGRLWELLEGHECQVLDQVEELSVWRRLSVLDRVVGLDASVEAAVGGHRIDRVAAAAWLVEQRDRDERGSFLARMRKVQVVALRC